VNISDLGARIALREPAELDDQVALALLSGRQRRGLVRWRIGLEVGLEFVD
jgi:hypothetical protein